MTKKHFSCKLPGPPKLPERGKSCLHFVQPRRELGLKKLLNFNAYREEQSNGKNKRQPQGRRGAGVGGRGCHGKNYLYVLPPLGHAVVCRPNNGRTREAWKSSSPFSRRRRPRSEPHPPINRCAPVGHSVSHRFDWGQGAGLLPAAGGELPTSPGSWRAPRYGGLIRGKRSGTCINSAC